MSDQTEDPTAGIRSVRPGIRYLIAAMDVYAAGRLAARADLSLRDWAWIPTTEGPPAIFEKLTAEQQAALAPPRGVWDTRV